MEIYGNYAGGMVTQAHPEKLRDNQSVLLENVDIKQGGVVQNRGAYSETHAPDSLLGGLTQGYFRYTRDDGYTDIVAIDGQLYTIDAEGLYTALPIDGIPYFQSSRPIEAVQVRTRMYIATGSGLVMYDGTTASLVEAYAPNGLEALYIGTNGLAGNPDNYLSDTLGAANAILGVTASSRYGVINEPVTFTAYIQQVTGDVLEFQFEIKKTVSAEYEVVQPWSTAKMHTITFDTKSDYMIRVSLRKSGTTTVLSQYVIPRYKVNSTPDENEEPTINFEDMKLCNRIFMHYDRLFLYGDTGNPDHLYISHLDKFNYFPRTNIIRISDTLRGSLQHVQQYKDFLVCFTDNSIQGIEGRNPMEFQKYPIHTTVGTKYPYSVQIMKNYITFVGNDNGVYILKSFNYASEDKLNVERIDSSVQDSLSSFIGEATKVESCIYDNQYYLYVEGVSDKLMYRFYYESGLWVRDRLPFNVRNLTNLNNTLHCTSDYGGIVYTLKNNVYVDGVNTPYSMKITSKDFNFNMPHHRKKLKQYQILAKLTAVTTIYVELYLDNNLIGMFPLTYDLLQNSDAQKLKVMASGRFRYVKTDITIPVKETVQLIGFAFVFKQNTPK